MLLMGWISEVVSDAVAKVDVWGWVGEVVAVQVRDYWLNEGLRGIVGGNFLDDRAGIVRKGRRNTVQSGFLRRAGYLVMMRGKRMSCGRYCSWSPRHRGILLRCGARSEMEMGRWLGC